MKWSAIMAAPEATFQQLLGLGERWRVVRTEVTPAKNTFVICAAATPTRWEAERARWWQRVKYPGYGVFCVYEALCTPC